jgi:hypothetical protein
MALQGIYTLEGGSPCDRGSVPRSEKLVGDLNIDALALPGFSKF